ncbi:MAG: 6-pyruvoyl trahydropterin synthase family protein [Ferruginibacter sp.]
MDNRKVAIYRKEHFNAAHRLNNPNWDAATNERIFGKCNNPNYHGHNYELIVKLIGIPDAQTGYVYDMKLLSDLIKKEIIDRYDHRNLNLDCVEFEQVNPSVENIAKIIYDILRAKIEPQFELQIRLFETERNYVDFPA